MDVGGIFSKSRQVLIKLGKIGLTIVLCAVLGFHAYKAFETGFFRYKIRVLNRIVPYSFSQLAVVEKVNPGLPQELSSYIHFYQKVVGYFPDQADAYGMLGFCYYYSGLNDKAIESYQKAIEQKSDFFLVLL